MKHKECMCMCSCTYVAVKTWMAGWKLYLKMPEFDLKLISETIESWN